MIAWGNTTDRILLLLKQEPMTKAEIQRKLDLQHDQIASVLARLNKKGKLNPKRIYISGYTRHAIKGKMHIRAVYALGDKPDAPKEIEPLDQSERSKRCYAKLMSLKNSSVFTQTMTRRELQREKAKAVQAKANTHTNEQSVA